MINQVTQTATTINYIKQKKEEEAPKQAQEAVVSKTDTFEKSPNTSQMPNTYAKPSVDKNKVNELIAESQKQTEEFKKMIYNLIGKQNGQYNLTLFGEKLNVSQQDVVKAQESIAEGGEYSMDAVSTRIMDMAQALSGGDASKIDDLRNAVKQGFDAAEKAFGGQLPQISKDTYDEVMKRFDEWQNPTKPPVTDEAPSQ